MRVISGYLKGRNIDGYDTIGTRPTMNRVKESMFASIQEYINDSLVLDLFSGSGSLGIEAISMGAKKCYFVDNGREILNILRKNINNLNIEDKSTIINIKKVKEFSNTYVKLENVEGTIDIARDRRNEFKQKLLMYLAGQE